MGQARKREVRWNPRPCTYPARERNVDGARTHIFWRHSQVSSRVHLPIVLSQRLPVVVLFWQRVQRQPQLLKHDHQLFSPPGLVAHVFAHCGHSGGSPLWRFRSLDVGCCHHCLANSCHILLSVVRVENDSWISSVKLPIHALVHVAKEVDQRHSSAATNRPAAVADWRSHGHETARCFQLRQHLCTNRQTTSRSREDSQTRLPSSAD